MLDIEKSIFNILLMGRKPDAAAMVTAKLTEKDFSCTESRLMFSVVKKLYDAGTDVNFVTVSTYTDERIASKVFPQSLRDALNSCIDADEFAIESALPSYIEQLQKVRSDRNALREIKAAEDALKKGEPYAEHLAAAMESATASAKDYLHSIDEIMPMVLASYGNDTLGIFTGYETLDRELNGLHPQDLIILAAYTALGKSTLSANMAVNMAKAGHRVLFFTAEMSSVEIGKKLLQAEAETAENSIRSNYNGAAEQAAQTALLMQKIASNLQICDIAGIGINELESVALSANSKRKVECIFVDYLQIIESDRKHNTRADEVAHISRRLKRLAQKIDCPIMAMSQIHRSIASSESHEPGLHNLSESSAIAQDANTVLLLHRPYQFDKTEDPNYAELTIAKNRNGRSGGKIRLQYAASITRFYEYGKMPERFTGR